MNRRTFLELTSLGALGLLGGHFGRRTAGPRLQDAPPLPVARLEPAPLDPLADEGSLLRPASPLRDPSRQEATLREAILDEAARFDTAPRDLARYLRKIRDFDRTYPEDYVLDAEQLAVLESAAGRLGRVQRIAGHGHFNLLGFDQMLALGRRYSRIGRFPREEIDFLEEIFFADARRYGFYGKKLLTEITAVVPERETVKVPGTGHYLFRGEPRRRYEKIRADVGDSVVLTSGVRGLVKQMHLFLDKAVATAGNLSQASRSLAPPGHSYHGVGDFDVGKVGFGLDNFTEAFADTAEYKRLVDLGYVGFRYTPTNPDGVRHEPWHIKMA